MNFHVLALDGAYRMSDGDLIFTRARPRSARELLQASVKVARRVMRLIIRRGAVTLADVQTLQT